MFKPLFPQYMFKSKIYQNQDIPPCIVRCRLGSRKTIVPVLLRELVTVGVFQGTFPAIFFVHLAHKFVVLVWEILRKFTGGFVGTFHFKGTFPGTFLDPFGWGIPVGNGARFYALQVHYYNPTEDTGVRDSSGVRMTLSPALRTHDAWQRFYQSGAAPPVILHKDGTTNYFDVETS